MILRAYPSAYKSTTAFAFGHLSSLPHCELCNSLALAFPTLKMYIAPSLSLVFWASHHQPPLPPFCFSVLHAFHIRLFCISVTCSECSDFSVPPCNFSAFLLLFCTLPVIFLHFALILHSILMYILWIMCCCSAQNSLDLLGCFPLLALQRSN